MGQWEGEKCAFGGPDAVGQCITIPASLYKSMSPAARDSLAREQGGVDDHLLLPAHVMTSLFAEVGPGGGDWAGGC